MKTGLELLNDPSFKTNRSGWFPNPRKIAEPARIKADVIPPIQNRAACWGANNFDQLGGGVQIAWKMAATDGVKDYGIPRSRQAECGS
jgi:hypothetical protein